MTKNSIMSEQVVSLQAAIISDFLTDGFLDIFDGPQPENAESELTTQVLLGGVRFTTFTTPSKGVIYAKDVTDGIVIESGRASWARCFKKDHRTVVMDVSVGESADANVILASTLFERGAIMEVIAFEHTVPTTTPGM
jgi:hypothetical protein